MKLWNLIFWIFVGLFCACTISDVVGFGYGGHRKRGQHGYGGGRHWRPRNGTRGYRHRNGTRTD
uniref:Hypothetical secreted peptide n=1 Tax=Simulium nigrimanum TaxID=683695 RepID=D1FPY2_SIMNI